VRGSLRQILPFGDNLDTMAGGSELWQERQSWSWMMKPISLNWRGCIWSERDQLLTLVVLVHRALGPGLLESAYEACLAFNWPNAA